MFVLVHQDSSPLDPEQLSDTTASAPGSDDDTMSTTANESSALRVESPPPAPIGVSVSAGSDSGGSQSGTGAYPGSQPELAQLQAHVRGEEAGATASGNVTLVVPPTDAETKRAKRLRALRTRFLDHFTRAFTQLRDVGGLRSIPYIQVILMLISDMQPDDYDDQSDLEKLLLVIVSQVEFRVSVRTFGN